MGDRLIHGEEERREKRGGGAMPRKNNRKQTPRKRVYFRLEAPGAYEYRILVDGQWQNGPGETVGNPYGEANNLRVID